MKRAHTLLWSLNFAIDGIVYALRTQRNMRLHMLAAVIVAVASLLLDITGIELVAVVFAISLVFITELINTALEAAVDVAVETYDPLAKVAKDVAAGAVLVSAINAVAVAYLVLFEPVQVVLQRGLEIIKFAPADLTVIALCIVLLAVIMLKALSREGTWLQGGWPSGHAAIAFGAAAILGYTTGSASALALGLFIALLVVQSRLEAEIHTLAQSIVGSLLGLLIVTAIFQVFFR